MFSCITSKIPSEYKYMHMIRKMLKRRIANTKTSRPKSSTGGRGEISLRGNILGKKGQRRKSCFASIRKYRNSGDPVFLDLLSSQMQLSLQKQAFQT